MSVDWSEAKAILLEVESLFNRDDDVRDVQDIKKMANEIEAHCSNNLKDAKEIIKRELQRLVYPRASSVRGVAVAGLKRRHAKRRPAPNGPTPLS